MTNIKFEVTKSKNTPVTDEELLGDLQKISQEHQTSKVTMKLYGENGKYDVTTISRRFGTWNKALSSAGLTTSNTINLPDEVLFENILILWQHYGRQPRRSELAKHPSKISQFPYNRRFKSWMSALENFVVYINASEVTAPSPQSVSKATLRQGGRDPSLRLRFMVLSRDKFTCRQCGASPAKDSSVELHIDHILPWSKGGETTFENLQTLCIKCNLGKSNL
jgi:hypothetical protein